MQQEAIDICECLWCLNSRQMRHVDTNVKRAATEAMSKFTIERVRIYPQPYVTYSLIHADVHRILLSILRKKYTYCLCHRIVAKTNPGSVRREEGRNMALRGWEEFWQLRHSWQVDLDTSRPSTDNEKKLSTSSTSISDIVLFSCSKHSKVASGYFVLSYLAFLPLADQHDSDLLRATFLLTIVLDIDENIPYSALIHTQSSASYTLLCFGAGRLLSAVLSLSSLARSNILIHLSSARWHTSCSE